MIYFRFKYTVLDAGYKGLKHYYLECKGGVYSFHCKQGGMPQVCPMSYEEAKRFETALMEAAERGEISVLWLEPEYLIDGVNTPIFSKTVSLLSKALPNVRDAYKRYRLDVLFSSYDKFLQSLCFGGCSYEYDFDARSYKLRCLKLKDTQFNGGKLVVCRDKNNLILLDSIIKEYECFTNKDSLIEEVEAYARKWRHSIRCKLRDKMEYHEKRLSELEGSMKEVDSLFTD